MVLGLQLSGPCAKISQMSSGEPVFLQRMKDGGAQGASSRPLHYGRASMSSKWFETTPSSSPAHSPKRGTPCNHKIGPVLLRCPRQTIFAVSLGKPQCRRPRPVLIHGQAEGIVPSLKEK
tara:strand:- start:119601 stop:119960 length:360 start_codon:yes stop_codon:yes gene_type:complete